jgi:hypothetical protein
MNDEHDPGQDPEMDPEQEARVRALLADLGTAPEAASMPPEVAARLDETIAGLVAERHVETEETASNVVPLRRRWATRAAAAAAAVIVVGAGGVAAANLGVFGGTNATSDSAAGGSTAGKAESLDSSTASPREPAPLSGGDAVDRLPRITASAFDTDVTRLLQQDLSAAVPDDSTARNQQRKAAEDGALADSLKETCPGPKLSGKADTRPVLYDGTEAVLVIHPEHRGARLVEAWTCTGDRVLDRARVPVTHETSGQSSPGDPGLGSPGPTP